ncbi:aminotransferase class I/II-fold pyridoxal phosphate-dependent enzyme [Microbacterium amylolyticum]|uniref:DNA-binding transcriptional MocR family regulator n=1 Tax=Microbacterium amylolyticum TaxID=936337 RepID=A0ABS4ZGB5_9MICO|nr:aminotransferase class I/II-fold pyridoxal phosphate-dependent enzyme [Microbacterium amylolyticum]MBP2435511.1 DNA-binding transcriptional MocR family regulator [Microbacterium amylolyticum]
MEHSDFVHKITGRTAAAIAEDVRAAIDRGDLGAGASLPSVRSLADDLGVNRNTVVAAYRHLSQAGLVESRGRAGTHVSRSAATAQEGFALESPLRDIAAGNPDASLIPDASRALASASARPVLYGEPVIDPGLESWAREWLVGDIPDGAPRLTITNGAFDAVERLLAQALMRDDAVAIEDPGFLATIRTVRLAGYRAIAVPVDAEGMTVDGLRDALSQGVRAIVVTPRAQNPTGASLSSQRAKDLREVLADHPYVLVIADDHFSLLSKRPYRSIIGPAHERWALVRSVSKFLGPDMSLAIVASDAHTADRLALRLSPGTTWVSHLLQRLAHAQLTDLSARATIEEAADHYAERNTAFRSLLDAYGIDVPVGDGLTLWVPVRRDAGRVAAQLMRRGWLARAGDEFQIGHREHSRHLRITVHHLDDTEQERLAADLASAIHAAT